MGRLIGSKTRGNPFTHAESTVRTYEREAHESCAWCGQKPRFLKTYSDMPRVSQSERRFCSKSCAKSYST